MNSRDKLRALALVWVAFVIICMVTFLGKPTIGLGEGVLGFFYFMGVIGASIAITESKPTADDSLRESASREQDARKAKREDFTLIDRMVESMDDEERAALLRRLGVPDEPQQDYSLTDDGELKRRR